MKKNIFAVCDLEVDYAFNFMDYLNQKKNLPFEIQAFTTAESLIAYGKENHIELLLISDKAMRKEVRDLGIGRMNGMSQTVNNLYFIPPVRTPSDIRTVDWEDWERLLQEIVLHSSYEVLILDMGENGDEDFRLLEMCRKIYMPVLNDTLSVCKVTQFENLLRIWNKEKILEKTEKVHLPFHMDRISSDAYVEQLVWSELGDYIRELLRKERS